MAIAAFLPAEASMVGAIAPDLAVAGDPATPDTN
jgi:hypothetical protein